MGYDKSRAVEILKTILDVSESQRRLAEAGDFERVIGLQERRESLLKELKGLDTREEDLKPLADEILKRDTELAALIERSIGEFKSKLEMIGKAARAVKAYTSF